MFGYYQSSSAYHGCFIIDMALAGQSTSAKTVNHAYCYPRYGYCLRNVNSDLVNAHAVRALEGAGPATGSGI